MKWMHRFCFGWMFLLAIANPADAAGPDRVLLLHPFGPDFSPWNTITPPFRAELRKKSPRPIDQRSNWQALAIGAGLASVVAAIATGSLPRWVRVTLVLGILVLACGGGLYAFRYFNHPTTLTVAAGSADGETVRLMSTIAARLASTNAPVRLQVVDTGNALDTAKAFSGGQADLAVLRADVGDLCSAETVVVVTRAVALIVAPPGSSITEMDDLKGKTIGVVGGEVNQNLVEA